MIDVIQMEEEFKYFEYIESDLRRNELNYALFIIKFTQDAKQHR